MRVAWDNPVARHAGRLALRRGWPLAVLGVLLAAGAAGAMIERHWMELEEYSFLQPSSATRTLATTLLGETLLVLPWASIRGALLWRRLRLDGHLDEYRRSRLSPGSITVGALLAALSPILVLLAVSALVSLGAAWFTRGLLLSEVLTAHLLLLAQAFAYAALGMGLASWIKHSALAIPLAVGLLGVAVGAVWAIDPFYRRMEDPPTWIYRALLPNPVTAIGNALNTDVLRFSWVYQRIHAHEYFFLYPPAWQTGGLYAAAGVLLTGLVAWRLRRAE